MRKAGAAELSIEEAEERTSVLTAIWEDRVGLVTEDRNMYGRRIRARNGAPGRDGLVEKRKLGGNKSGDAGGGFCTHRWTARDTAVTARMVQYLDKSESLEVDIEELKIACWGQRSETSISGTFVLNARGEKLRRLFHAFSVQGLSGLLVASVARWDEHARKLGIHEQKCQELSQTIKCMSESQEKLLEMLERKHSLFKEAPDDLRKHTFPEIRELDERSLKKKWNCRRATPPTLNTIKNKKEERQNGGREREKLVAGGGVNADDRRVTEIQLLLEVFSLRRQWRVSSNDEGGRNVESLRWMRKSIRFREAGELRKLLP